MKTVQHVALMTLAALGLILPAEAARYRLTDLGYGVEASDINDYGQVVGRNGAYASLWTNGAGWQSLGALPGDVGSAASGINDLGQVVGASFNSPVVRAFIWNGGSVQNLSGLLWASEINNLEQVVGESSLRRAGLWTSSGGMQDLGVLSGHHFSVAWAINDGGKVVGTSELNTGARRAFLWTSSGGMQDLGVLLGGNSSEAWDINNAGEVVGGSGRAFLWTSSGGMQDLGDLPGGTDDSTAYGINDAGHVVGASFGSVPLNTSAFLWTSAEGMIDLNTLLDASGSGWHIGRADAINNAGQIIALGSSPASCCRSVLLTPIPGDFNLDGQWDCSDIDSLVGVIAAGTNDPTFDLTSDGIVDTGDLTQWLADAGAINRPSGSPYLPGDANLNGDVDGSDFGIWNANKFTSVAAWCSGDFNANGNVDGTDFGIWNANKFTSSANSVVPEPTGVLLPLLAWICVSSFSRKPDGAAAASAERRKRRTAAPGGAPARLAGTI